MLGHYTLISLGLVKLIIEIKAGKKKLNDYKPVLQYWDFVLMLYTGNRFHHIIQKYFLLFINNVATYLLKLFVFWAKHNPHNAISLLKFNLEIKDGTKQLSNSSNWISDVTVTEFTPAFLTNESLV